MSFNNRRYIKDNYAQVKPVRNILPYTISAIGGADELKEWKYQQKVKEEQYQVAKAERFMTKREQVIQGMCDGSLAAKWADDSNQSLGTVLYKNPVKKQATTIPQEPVIIAKVSLWTKAMNWLSNLFINLPN